MQSEKEEMDDRACAQWSAALGVDVTVEMWRTCCAQTGMLSPSSSHRIIHFKFLHRTYRTPVRLSKAGLRDTDCCDRCHAENANSLHFTWGSPEISGYWSKVANGLTEMVEFPVKLEPVVALLGEVRRYPRHCRRFLPIALLLTKRLVACRWGRGRAPTYKLWIADLIYCSGSQTGVRGPPGVHDTVPGGPRAPSRNLNVLHFL